MFMKNFFTTIGFVLQVTFAGAQVYTINPVYDCETIELNKNSLELHSIDTFTRGSFIVDLDNMVITSPATVARIITIKKVNRLDDNLLKLTLKKEHRYSPEVFYLQLDAAGKPLYIQDAGVVFKTYTTTGAALTLRSACTRVKKAVIPYTMGEAPPDAKLKMAMEKARDSSYNNKFELNNGTVTWTEGKGRDAVVHKLNVSGSVVSTNKDNYFIQLTGIDDAGDPCNVMFFRTSKNYPYNNFIYVERVINGTWVAMRCY
jgi:hypothetical protein